jgi:hypothetical protein
MNLLSLSRRVVFGLISMCLLLQSAIAASRSSGRPSTQASIKGADVAHQLWTENIKPILARPVNTSAGAYYSGEMLMVPLHAAFAHNDPEWEKDFADYFQQFMKSHDQLTDVLLSRLQFLYLGSQFIVLAEKSHHSDLIPPGLPDLLFSEVQAAWQEKPAIEWEHAPFKGVRERVLWKLNTRNVAKSYFRAMGDDDCYVFAVAADLRTYGGTPAQEKAWRAPLNDILEVTHRVYTQEVSPTPIGGWLLQPGVWRDHPDFQYAGNPRAAEGIKRAPLSDVSWDSSHSARFPLWLTSAMNAYGEGSSWHNFYANLRSGLAKQFVAKVLVPPGPDSACYRLNNYMDGRNGVYRWGYKELGENIGYGPYQTSGTLLLGFWIFLDDAQVKSAYRNVASQYPWPKECLELYLGPNPNGAPYSQKDMDPKSPQWRLRYLLVMLASQL